MRIVLDGRMILPFMTGVGRYLLGLIGGYCGNEDGSEIELWVQPNLPNNHPIWAFQSHRINIKQLPIHHMTFQQQWIIPAMVKKTDLELFHYPHFDLPFFIKGKIVVTIHDLKYLSHPEYFPNFSFSKRILQRLLMFHSVHRADAVIAVSKHTKQDIIRYFRIDPDKIKVISEGVGQNFNNQLLSGNQNLVLDQYRINFPFILSVGEQRPHKNLIGLIKAFSYFKSHAIGPHHLVITGKKYADYDEPEQLVTSLVLSDLVHFVYIDDQDLPVMYRAADAFCLVSKYEGFGLPILEAMASGTPVVAANKTSLPEVVGNAGILVDPDQPEEVAHALSRVISGGDLRSEKISAGLEWVKKFTWEKCAQQTLAVYADVLQLKK